LKNEKIAQNSNSNNISRSSSKSRIPKKYVSKIPIPLTKKIHNIIINNNSSSNNKLNGINETDSIKLNSQTKSIEKLNIVKVNSNINYNIINNNKPNYDNAMDRDDQNNKNEEIKINSIRNTTNTNIEKTDDTLNFHESYIARKAFTHWKEFTKNAIDTRKANNHFIKVLKKKGLHAFKYQTWIVRREWKLEIRADVHYKHVIFQKCFIAWEIYRENKSQKKKILEKVDNYGNL